MYDRIYVNQSALTKFPFQITREIWKIFEVIRRAPEVIRKALITKFTLEKEINT